MNLSRKTIRIVKALALLSALTIEVLILFSFFSPWYHYYDINQDAIRYERFRGLQIVFIQPYNPQPPQKSAWSDVNYTNLEDLFTVIMIILIIVFVIQLFLFILVALSFLSNWLPMGFRLGLSMFKKKVKKIIIIIAAILALLLFIAWFAFYYEHPKQLNLDVQAQGQQNSFSSKTSYSSETRVVQAQGNVNFPWTGPRWGYCYGVDDVTNPCLEFMGPAGTFGVSIGWTLIVISNAICIVQVVCLGLYGYHILKKSFNYTRI